MKTGKKIVLSNRQKEAAQVIFGDKLGQQIIDNNNLDALIEEVSSLKAAVAGLKAAVDTFDSKLTDFERAKGIDLSGRFFQSNGQPDTGLTASYFGGKQ